MDNSVLDDNFLEALTGYKSPARQAECLRKHNIFYVEGRDGRIRTTIEWLKQAGVVKQQLPDEFHLEALD